ncbi:MAG: nuclear transport factor 2 family protein [Ketobacter sp. GenoA1]|nr:MAG: nuclear transport factor 2 family protein [Ketobacter sp. GenoA1]RLT98529.1 MAG: nuclear transport factor 2 family protein [Ketobacter sp.]
MRLNYPNAFDLLGAKLNVQVSKITVSKIDEKRCVMRKLSLFIVVFFCSSLAFSDTLTEKQVHQLIDRMDSAINAKDAKAVLEEMSDNIEIVINIEAQGQTQTMRPSKAEYKDMLVATWVHYSEYKYDRGNTKISINNDQAVISADITESININGQEMTGQSKEKVTVQIVDDKPKITKVVAFTSM